jgi:hypothetical protein
MTESFKQQLKELIDKAAEKYVFETNGHKWSNNNDECGDNFGSFKQGCEFLMPVLMKAVEQRDFGIGISSRCPCAPKESYNKELLQLLKG